MKLIVATLLVAATAMSAAHAQTVYRCGSTYSQAPCPGAKLVEVSDARSPVQQAEAQRVADDERRLASEMRRERLADERATGSGAASSLSGASSPTRLAGLGGGHHKKKNGFGKAPATTDFIAFDPSSRKRRSGA